MEGFDGQGLFVRVVAWPEDEVFALARRERGTSGQGPSEVTWIRRGVPAPVRGTEEGREDCTQLCYDRHELGAGFGLLMPARRVEWWFTGVGKRGPDDTKREEGRRFDNGSGEFHQLWEATPEQIAAKMAELRPLVKEMPVNEAHVHYRVKDVCGLLVNPASVKSIARAAGFLTGVLRTTEEEVGFYTYDATKGELTKVKLADMKAQKHCRRFEKKVTVFQIVFRFISYFFFCSTKIMRASTKPFGFPIESSK